MLFVIFLLVYNNVSIDKYVVEQEELSCFWFFATHLCQDTLSHKDPTLLRQRLKNKVCLV